MRALQEVAVVVGLAACSVTLADVSLEAWGGLLVRSIGVAWFVLAWAGLVRPVRTGQVAGAVAALLGPLMMVGAGRGGLVLGVVTAAALVAASVGLRETVLSGLGVLGLFVFIPQTVSEFFGDQLGAPVGCSSVAACSWAWPCGWLVRAIRTPGGGESVALDVTTPPGTESSGGRDTRRRAAALMIAVSWWPLPSP